MPPWRRIGLRPALTDPGVLLRRLPGARPPARRRSQNCRLSSSISRALACSCSIRRPLPDPGERPPHRVSAISGDAGRDQRVQRLQVRRPEPAMTGVSSPPARARASSERPCRFMKMPGPSLSAPNWNSSRFASGSLSERSCRSVSSSWRNARPKSSDDAFQLGQLSLGGHEDPDRQLPGLDDRIVAVLQHSYPFDAAAGESRHDVVLDQLLDVIERCLLHDLLLGYACNQSSSRNCASVYQLSAHPRLLDRRVLAQAPRELAIQR